MISWVVWGLALALTNGFSTLVSRARNTPDYKYHGICSALNHGTWFVVNFMFVGVAIDIKDQQGWRAMGFAWAFYTVCSTIGSIVVHYIAINYFERGTRRVGSYES